MAEDVAATIGAAGIDRIECVIECVGKTATMKQAIELAGRKSTVMLFGLSKPNDTIDIKPFEIFNSQGILHQPLHPEESSRSHRLG